VLPSTLSRASWVAVIIGSLFVIVHSYNIRKWYSDLTRNKLLKGALLVASVTIFVTTTFGIYNLKKDSADGRLLMWKISAQQIANNPLLGSGINKFTHAFGNQQAQYFHSHEFDEKEALVAGKGEYAFNEFLKIGVEHGLIGIVFFLTIIICALQVSFANYSNSKMIVATSGSLISLLVFSLFSYPFSMTPLLLNLFFFLCIISALSPNNFNVRIGRGSRIILFILIFLGCPFILKMQLNKYQIMQEWKVASLLSSNSSYKEAIEIMNKIEPELCYRGDFMLDYGQILAINENYVRAIRVLKQASNLTSDPYLFNSLGQCYQALKMYEEAELCYLHAYYLIPHKFYPRYLLVKLYEERGDLASAKILAMKVKKMYIKVKSKAIDEILKEMDRVINL
ncbi:MAG: O-antigen ligase family protein, partial [Fulvivirga sp.]|uniref:O-antigen ligase family protein n=1 Tax=Fulvivirga sp. TaxID=1931237 RepID=UPI0032F0670D